MKHPGSTRYGHRGGGRRVGALAVLATALGLTLSGCGIRDTALPVDAGPAASRTACPPAPDATLSRLTAAETILPTTSRYRQPPGGPPQSAVAAAAAAAKVKAAERQAEREKLGTRPTARTTPLAPAVPSSASASPAPTASDGSLICSRPSSVPTPTARPYGLRTPGPTAPAAVPASPVKPSP